eukprot:scaffold21250_cov17-Tisochrysis_lutea.AAC.1
MVASAAARCLLMRTRNSLPCPSCCFCFCCCCFCCCAGREATPAHCCCPACAAKVGSTCAWVWVRPWGAGAGTARQACKAWWVVWLRCSMRRSTRRWRLGMPGAATAAGAAPDPAAADAAAASVAALGRGSPAAPWPRCCCPCALVAMLVLAPDPAMMASAAVAHFMPMATSVHAWPTWPSGIRLPTD